MAIIKINRKNFYHNLNQIALQTGSVDKIAIVLKDNAYGHGLELVANLALSYGIKHAVVRTLDEAEKIVGLFETLLVLGDTIIADTRYRFVINDLRDLETAPKGANVELKVDTGMHRNGIAIDEVAEALLLIGKKSLNLLGVMTHYRSADVLSSEFFWQKKQFERVKSHLKKAGYGHIRFHSHNSASILRSKGFDEDLVRLGIGAYGHNELPPAFDTIALKPVLSLHASRVSTRNLKRGERIGYGGDFTAPREMQVSTYSLGYGDGWMRGEYASKPFVTAQGLPLLGRVSMDFVSLEGDRAEVCITDNAQQAAGQLGTISYEITTILSREIERIVV